MILHPQEVYDDQEESDLDDNWVTPDEYYQHARRTVSVGRFNKIAYPDLYGSKAVPYKEPLYERKFGVQRSVSCFRTSAQPLQLHCCS